MAPFTDVPGASPSTLVVVPGLTTRGLSTDNIVNIAFGLATIVLSVLGILLTWRCGRRVVSEPTNTGMDDRMDDQQTSDVELQRLTQPGDGYELTLQLRRHA